MLPTYELTWKTMWLDIRLPTITLYQQNTIFLTIPRLSVSYTNYTVTISAPFPRYFPLNNRSPQDLSTHKTYHFEEISGIQEILIQVKIRRIFPCSRNCRAIFPWTRPCRISDFALSFAVTEVEPNYQRLISREGLHSRREWKCCRLFVGSFDHSKHKLRETDCVTCCVWGYAKLGVNSKIR